MDLNIKSETFGADDMSWVASRHGLESARSITLDVSTFTKADHYPQGFLMSGLPLAKNATSKKYVPYNNAGTGGAEVLVGHLLGHVSVPTDTANDVGGALLIHGVVEKANLPVQVDTAGQADVAGRITYV